MSATNPLPPEDEDLYRDILKDALLVGAKLGALIAQEVDAAIEANKADPERPKASPALTAAYDRYTRALRHTIHMRKHLADPAPDQPGFVDRVAARKKILRAVGDAIHRHVADPYRAERFHAELGERFDDPDLDEDILTRPADEIIAELCADFAIIPAVPGRPATKRRTPDDIDAIRALAKMVPIPWGPRPLDPESWAQPRDAPS